MMLKNVIDSRENNIHLRAKKDQKKKKERNEHTLGVTVAMSNLFFIVFSFALLERDRDKQSRNNGGSFQV